MWLEAGGCMSPGNRVQHLRSPASVWIATVHLQWCQQNITSPISTPASLWRRPSVGHPVRMSILWSCHLDHYYHELTNSYVISWWSLEIAGQRTCKEKGSPKECCVEFWAPGSAAVISVPQFFPGQPITHAFVFLAACAHVLATSVCGCLP